MIHILYRLPIKRTNKQPVVLRALRPSKTISGVYKFKSTPSDVSYRVEKTLKISEN